MSDADCIFCRIVAGDLPSDIVYETESTIAFKDIHPAAELHVLVIPRRHIDDASVVTADDGPVLAERGYRLIFNIGPDAMNSVPHLHLHVLGGKLAGHVNSQ
jgi:histidine triad (HIT) family protein